MKLYYTPGVCSMAVHIALREAGLPVTLAKVDLLRHKLAVPENGTDDYYTINPRGYVPLLQLDDGSRHTEAASLLQYIADLVPERALLPAAGTRERLEATGWITLVSTELHKVFSPWLWHKETAQSTVEACKAKLKLRFAELDKHLQGRQYLTGDTFTVADAYCFTILGWARMLMMPLTAYPTLQDYLSRIAARPAVQEAMRAEGLVRD
ncbi:glutathione transferase GstA [Cupriavidus necator]|uniref:Glutathione transferase GstA n=1 Tax=Cupriavidus necator TaxID=106590 RepID=A0A367PK95_CUPNE|nr:glutathione transferase GstA [Cupriavidus necator]QQX84462.1 glutathione transferase GstA [Cupriavidus necator]RCJ07963.1 glutathione transferase GstA [Cupriavidus necator]